jgi:hypothetical protein
MTIYADKITHYYNKDELRHFLNELWDHSTSEIEYMV